MGWRVRSYQTGDEQQILSLFERVFRIQRSLEHWRWKFLANPAGHQISLAVSDTGEIVGQFAGLPARAASADEDFILTQGIDNMLDPAYRGSGAFAGMVNHFLETFVWSAPEVAFYGYNLARKHDLDKRIFAMELVHPVTCLRWDLSRPDGWRQSLAVRARALTYSVERVARFPGTVDQLWARCRHELGVTAVRDARYLNWRYADCPDTEYALMLATERLSGRAAGLAVLRFGWFEERIAPLVDWLAPRDHEAVGLALLGACHRLARDRGLAAVSTWFPPWTNQRGWLRSLGYHEESTPFLLTVLNDGHVDRVKLLKESWYYTMGDSDIY